MTGKIGTVTAPPLFVRTLSSGEGRVTELELAVLCSRRGENGRGSDGRVGRVGREV